jgi:hypothetical protein
MEPVSFGLIVSGVFAGLVTLGVLQSVVHAANGRVWEIALWTLATLAALAAAGWCLVRTLSGEKPETATVWATALAPLPVTLALIVRSWWSRPKEGANAPD